MMMARISYHQRKSRRSWILLLRRKMVQKSMNTYAVTGAGTFVDPSDVLLSNSVRGISGWRRDAH